MKLGSRVRDTVTNFIGIATARMERFEGSPTVLVEAQLDPDLEPPPAEMALAEGGAPQFATLRSIGNREVHQYWFEESRLVEV